MNKDNVYTHNDVTFTKLDDKEIFTHKENKFSAFTPSAEEKISYFHELHTTPVHGIRILLHLHYHAYVLVNPQGIVIGKKIQSYDEAIKKAEAIDREYASWLVKHTCKGMPKTKFISEVKANKLKAKLVSCNMKGRELDTDFHPLVKRKGFGSIDVYRSGNGYSTLFYVNDMPTSRMVYTGTELLIYKSGFRLYNEHEKSVLAQWETMRDPKEEWLDAMTDGSTQYWRKKVFFDENNVGYLLTADYKGLVMDDTIRGELSLEYEIKQN